MHIDSVFNQVHCRNIYIILICFKLKYCVLETSGSETLFLQTLGLTKVKKKKIKKKNLKGQIYMIYDCILRLLKCMLNCILDSVTLNAFFGILLVFDFQEKQNGCLVNVDTYLHIS